MMHTSARQALDHNTQEAPHDEFLLQNRNAMTHSVKAVLCRIGISISIDCKGAAPETPRRDHDQLRTGWDTAPQ